MSESYSRHNVTMKLLICISILIKFGESLPLGGSKPLPPQKPKEGYNYAGKPFFLPTYDVKLTDEQQRSGIIGDHYRWQNLTFYVQIDPAFNETERVIINNALYELDSNICLDILIWPSDSQPSGDYVFIRRGELGEGCWSLLGRAGGRQDLYLQYDWCIDHGIIQHEAIHALGFFHEQSRPDRDDYVEILWDNIDPGSHSAFDKYGWDFVDTFGVPYDYRSVMHYSGWDFSSNGGETIRAWNGSPVGTEGRASAYDFLKVNRMYDC